MTDEKTAELAADYLRLSAADKTKLFFESLKMIKSLQAEIKEAREENEMLMKETYWQEKYKALEAGNELMLKRILSLQVTCGDLTDRLGKT